MFFLQNLSDEKLKAVPILVQQSPRLTDPPAWAEVEQIVLQPQKHLTFCAYSLARGKLQTLGLLVQTQPKISQPRAGMAQPFLSAVQTFAS